MKKVSSLIVILFLCFSCGNSDVTLSREEYNKLKGEKVFTAYVGDIKTNFKEVVVDSCEYIYAWERTNSTVFTHKGNCKFCAKRKTK